MGCTSLFEDRPHGSVTRGTRRVGVPPGHYPSPHPEPAGISGSSNPTGTWLESDHCG